MFKYNNCFSDAHQRLFSQNRIEPIPTPSTRMDIDTRTGALNTRRQKEQMQVIYVCTNTICVIGGEAT